MKEVFICDALRTPIGSFLGTLSSIPAPKLAAELIKKILDRNGLTGQEINEVIMGNVLSAGIGQAPARQAALFGGLPESVECMTINKVCGSGLKAVMLAEQAIKCDDASLILAGGMESMSNAPFLLKGVREGVKFGHQNLYDSMLYDGLIDVYSNAFWDSMLSLSASDIIMTLFLISGVEIDSSSFNSLICSIVISLALGSLTFK